MRIASRLEGKACKIAMRQFATSAAVSLVADATIEAICCLVPRESMSWLILESKGANKLISKVRRSSFKSTICSPSSSSCPLSPLSLLSQA